MATTTDRPDTAAAETLELGIEAYVYLYPLVLMELTRRQAPVPMGSFQHLREFPDADFRAVVRPNFDTLYSVAWLDLTHEPMLVSAPDTGGRYYLLPMYDMWTDAFAVPGKRTTGTAAAGYAVLPPGWSGSLPDGVAAIQAPTPHVWIIGRTQTNGPADYPAVHRVQDGFSIAPLSGRAGQADLDTSADTETPPLDLVNAMPAREFFSLGTALLGQHRPHLSDFSILARMARVGLRPGSFEPAAELDDVPAAALETMRAALPRMAPVIDGWQMNVSTMGVYGNHYLKRAIVAMVGLGANPPEDAVYPLCVADADGRPLDGGTDYVLHFERDELPPVGAFWSVTMYDAEGFQAANELDRFAIGDRDDLAYNADGSLDLFLQHANPGPDRVANWLPAPRGPLGVTMRLYAPAPEVLDGRWNPPAIRRAG